MYTAFKKNTTINYKNNTCKITTIDYNIDFCRVN